jgi:hypothetical protein
MTNTYTQEELEDIMHQCLGNWDRELTVTFQCLEKDKDFQAEAKVDKYTPSNWLYYAQGDVSLNHAFVIEETLEEYRKEKLETQHKKLLEQLTGEKQPPSATDILKALRSRKHKKAVLKKNKPGGAV